MKKINANGLMLTDKGNGWLIGTFRGLRVSAKVYDEPSQFGIEGGRVSKLWIKNDLTGIEVNYDRGWDIGEELARIWRPVLVRLERVAVLAVLAEAQS